LNTKQAINKLRKIGIFVDFDKCEKLWYIDGYSFDIKELYRYANLQKQGQKFIKAKKLNKNKYQEDIGSL